MPLYPPDKFQEVINFPVKNIYGTKTYFYATLLFLTLLCAIFYDGGILKVVSIPLSENVSRSYYIIAAFSLASSAVLMEFSAILFTLALFAYFLILNIMGSNVGPNAFTNSMVLNYCALAYAPIIAYFFRRGNYSLVKNIALAASSIYALIYIYVSARYADNIEVSANAMIAASDGRDARIFMNAVAVAISMGIAAGGLKTGSGSFPINASILLIDLTALYLSKSRQIEFVAITTLIIYFIFGQGRILTSIYCSVFIIGIMIFLFWYLQDFSVYLLFASDKSAIARNNELIYAGKSFSDNPLLGVGIYNPIPQNWHGSSLFDKSKSIFWNDLGIYGIFYCAGAIGCLLFMIMSLMTLASRQRYMHIGAPNFLADGLGISGVIVAVSGFSSTLLWNNGCEIFAFVLAAYCCPPSKNILPAPPRTDINLRSL